MGWGGKGEGEISSGGVHGFAFCGEKEGQVVSVGWEWGLRSPDQIPACPLAGDPGDRHSRGHSLSSLKRKASWYSFMYCVERDSSRKSE